MGLDFPEADVSVLIGKKSEIHTAMSDSKRDDPNLAEVKAILGRLQRISRKPVAGSAPGDEGLPSLRPGGMESTENSGASPPAEAAAARAKAPRLVKAALVAVPVLAVIGGAVVFLDRGHQPAALNEASVTGVPETVAREAASGLTTGARPVTDAKPVTDASKRTPDDSMKSPLAVAVQLLKSGRVQDARAALLRAMPDDSSDVAWTLARSYDPNYIVTLPGADAGPDVAEATKWYRTWYDLAVKEGAVSDRISLDRILKAMD